MKNNILCIYHGKCADGFGAAMAVRRKYGADNVDFHPGIYQKSPPDVADREVILVDFSYKRPVLIEMAEKAKSILILDHHTSAEKDLVDLPGNVTVLFDMERSGAMIAWNHFFPKEPVPTLIHHIQDRDLWQFKLEGTREIQAALFLYPFEFPLWEQLLKNDPDDLYQEGVAISRKHLKDVNELIAVGAYRMTIAGHDIPVLNAPFFFSSDAGHIMGRGELFSATYWDTPEGRTFALRSDENGLDVSEIAAKFGGGGHKHAAGYKVARSILIKASREVPFGDYYISYFDSESFWLENHDGEGMQVWNKDAAEMLDDFFKENY